MKRGDKIRFLDHAIIVDGTVGTIRNKLKGGYFRVAVQFGGSFFTIDAHDSKLTEIAPGKRVRLKRIPTTGVIESEVRAGKCLVRLDSNMFHDEWMEGLEVI